MGETADFPEFLLAALSGGMDTAEVANQVVKAIRLNELYIMTHPDAKAGFEMRSQAMLAAFDH
jgi:hypothetical protein